VLIVRNTPGDSKFPLSPAPVASTPTRARLLSLAFIGALVIGAFLRLFQPDATQFWNDGGGTYTLAYEVLSLHGVPISSIRASIGTFSPPAAIYFYLPPALLGSPTLGNIETALAIVATIALTYDVCRRYLNPVIGVITTLLFSVSTWSVIFSRFIWQPSLQVPFTVLLVAAVLAGVVGKRRSWLAWALPLLGILIQMHPVTASFLGLIVIGWLLAPETVRVRDLAIGGVVTLALYIPTIIFEAMTGFADLPILLRTAKLHASITATVFHRFLDINSLVYLPAWADSPIYRGLNIAWEALVVCGMLYLALRVIVPSVSAIRRSLGATNWRERVVGVLGWMRTDAQARWRTDLILLLWPSLIMLVQIRHTTPIEIHYLIATFPAQFIAVAILLYDLNASVSYLGSRSRLAAAGAVSISSVLVAVVCILQIVGTTASYLGPQPRYLQAQKAGLAKAQHLAAQYHVDSVIFQLDYETIAPTNYMLQTSYPFPVPTQIVASQACLAGAPSKGARVLYLMTGAVSPWESLLSQVPGVHDLMGNMSAGDYFRAYVVTPEQLTARLQSFGKTALTAPISFGDVMVADHIWQAPLPGQSASALAIESHLAIKPSASPFHLTYGLAATLADANDHPMMTGSAYCNITPWIPQQTLYYLIPQVTTAGITQGATLSLSAGDKVFDAGDKLHIGPLRLISAYDLTVIDYTTAPTATHTFEIKGCGESSIVCAGADKAVVHPG
jgi:hypothetical protein